MSTIEGIHGNASPINEAATTTMVAAGAESLRKGLIHTAVRPIVAKTMIALFVIGIAMVPLLQLGVELVHRRGVRELDVVRPPVRAGLLAIKWHPRQAVRTLRHWLTRQNLADYEDTLAQDSAVRRRVQPRVQEALCRYLGFGNTMSFVAPRGWLFYSLGLDYLSGPGFLEAHAISKREQAFYDDGETEIGADPRPAIIRFHRDLQAAGVHLVFVPIPVKQMIQPGQMGSRLAFDRPIATPNNPDYARFIGDLRKAGVDVFDPTPAKLLPGERPRYLPQDTHWTPQWMEEVAGKLVEHINRTVALGPAPRETNWAVRAEMAARVGDIAETLSLRAGQTLFRPQTAQLKRVVDARTGEDWQPREDADVVFIGDSFSNIYSSEEMGFGVGAGFPQQVSRLLGRDLDMIVINGGAASDAREELARRPRPLVGKKLVIWEVSMHELTSSNWRVIPVRSE